MNVESCCLNEVLLNMSLIYNLIVIYSIQGETEEKEGKAVYKWLPRQEEVQKEERNKASRKKPDSPSSVSTNNF